MHRHGPINSVIARLPDLITKNFHLLGPHHVLLSEILDLFEFASRNLGFVMNHYHGIGLTAAGFVPINYSLLDPDAVYIPRDEYNRLIQISHQYASLRGNLIRGGVTDETIALLSDNHPGGLSNKTVPTPASRPSLAEEPVEAHQPVAFEGTTSQPFRAPTNHTHNQWTDADQAYDDDESLAQDTPGDINPTEDSPRNHLERVATRTLLLSNLAEGTCHADITAVVRGGQLVDIFVRRKDKSATVSFLRADDARAFYEHVRRYDLYIKQKRVEVSWNDRQFVLPDHLTHKIRSGATRNLVIRHCSTRRTEDEVREDLDHIHNLVVVRIDFIQGNCYISTNSVAGASFARTCMMSRLKYKGSRIEFDVDECAQSLDRLAVPRRGTLTNALLPKTPSIRSTVANRFQLLDLDEEQ